LEQAPAAMKTCLIVDDSRIIRKVARRILEDLGFEVCEAADGAEALAYCRSEMPDMILLDWRMPVMDGVTFVRQLRLEAGGEAPRVLFCTVETEVERIREALQAGADEYVMKPFDADILESKLAEAGLV
jgi:two-component system chemotaxis response regulator CheY